MLNLLGSGHFAVSRLPQISLDCFNRFVAEQGIRSLYEASVAEPLEIGQSVRDALAQPIDYPALHHAVMPGERVAIVIHRAIPQVVLIAKFLAEELVNALGCEVQLLFPHGPASGSDPLPEESSAITSLVHDPDQQNQLAIIGIDRQDNPLYVNRALFDADVVIPLTCYTARDADDGIVDCVVPQFLGRSQQNDFEEATNAHRRGIVRLVNENLGMFVAAQAVLGPGGDIRGVLIGEKTAVRRQAQQLLEQHWKLPVDERYPVVIVSLEGPAASQTWEQFAAALITAQQCACPGAALVVYSQLASKPRGEWQSAFDPEIRGSGKKLSETSRRLAQIVADHPIYLISAIKDADVESLGMGPIKELTELQRLIQRHGTPILVRDADQALVEFLGQPTL